MNIIAKHLKSYLPQIKPFETKLSSPSVCAFTGNQITHGYPVSWLISDVFTDYEYMKHSSGYVCEDIALIIKEVIPNGRGKFNSLRNYSFYADENELRLLKREEILDLLLGIPASPFAIAVTYSNKKHLSFKCKLQADPNHFVVTTDKGEVAFDRRKVDEVLHILRRWYAIIPEKATTSAQPTYFSKDDILYGNPAYQKIATYGLDRFEEENNVLERFRNTQLLELLTFTLNKQLQ